MDWCVGQGNYPPPLINCMCICTLLVELRLYSTHVYVLPLNIARSYGSKSLYTLPGFLLQICFPSCSSKLAGNSVAIGDGSTAASPPHDCVIRTLLIVQLINGQHCTGRSLLNQKQSSVDSSVDAQSKLLVHDGLSRVVTTVLSTGQLRRALSQEIASAPALQCLLT